MDYDRSIREEQDNLTHKVKSCADIVERASRENRMLTDADNKEIDRLKGEIDGHKARIDQLQKDQKRRNEVNQELENLLRPAPEPETRIAVQSDRALEAKTFEVPYKARSLRAFDRVYETRKDKEKAAWISGCFMAAAFYNRDGKHDKAARALRDMGYDLRALAEGVGAAGGFLVPTETDAGIIDNREQYGVFRQYANVKTVGTDQTYVPAVNGSASATFVGENGTFAESDKSWKNIEINPKKCGFITRMSSELTEDSIIDMGNDFVMEAGRALALLEDTVGFAGAGTAAHGSIIGVSTKFNNDNGLLGAVDIEAGDNTFEEVTQTGISMTFATLPDYAAQDAAIYCSRVCNELVFNRLKGTAGGNTPQTLSGEFGMNYQGYPIRISQVLPTSTGSLDNLTMFLFGDLRRAAVMAVRRGISISSSGERYFELDQIAFKVSQRFDVVVHDVGTASVAGPIVAAIGVA